MINIKDGVVFKKITENTVKVFVMLEKAFRFIRAECWITSANDGKHASDSRHYQDRAFDLRTRHLTDKQVKDLVFTMIGSSPVKGFRIKMEIDRVNRWWIIPEDIKIIIPAVRWESQHIHIEWEE